MRKALAALVLVGALAVGFYVLTRSGAARLTVRGHADDPAAVIDACDDLPNDRLSFAMQSAGPVSEDFTNLTADVRGDDAAARIERCFREQGSTDVGTAPTEEPTSLEDTGP